MNIGITGGIACGKSTVLHQFEHFGFAVLSSDQVVAQLYAEDTTLKTELRERFGKDIFNAQGDVLRPRLAEIVFADEAALLALEDMVHPRVGTFWQAAINAHAQRNWAIEIPLLFEKKLEKHFDYTVAITSHEHLQLARAQAKGWSMDQVRRRMNRQWPLQRKALSADFVICNDGSLDFLHKQTEWLLSRIL